MFWQAGPHAQAPAEPLSGDVFCDFVVVVAGFTGAWAALLLAEREPSASIVMLEAGRIAGGTSGSAGGFVDPALVHTIANAERRWPDESHAIVELGNRNMNDLVSTVEREKIACGLRMSGEYDVALEPWQQEQLEETAACC